MFHFNVDKKWTIYLIVTTILFKNLKTSTFYCRREFIPQSFNTTGGNILVHNAPGAKIIKKIWHQVLIYLQNYRGAQIHSHI